MPQPHSSARFFLTVSFTSHGPIPFMNPETLVLKPRRHMSTKNKDCQRIENQPRHATRVTPQPQRVVPSRTSSSTTRTCKTQWPRLRVAQARRDVAARKGRSVRRRGAITSKRCSTPLFYVITTRLPDVLRSQKKNDEKRIARRR